MEQIKNYTLGFIKIKTLAHQKTPLRKLLGKPKTQRNYLQITCMTNYWCPQHIKNFPNSTIKRKQLNKKRQKN